MEWKIWYGDGSYHSNKDGDWAAAPKENVQLIVVYSGGSKDFSLARIYKNKDYYDFDGSDFYMSNDTRDLPNFSIKYGKWTTKNMMKHLWKLASEDN